MADITDIKKTIKEIEAATQPDELKPEIAAKLKEMVEYKGPEKKKLSDEQKKQILEEIKKTPGKIPKIQALARLAFPDEPNADGRSWHGILIKSFLAELDIKTVGMHVYVPDKEIVLTDQQKEYLANNISPTCGILQAGKDAFNNQNLTNLHAEIRACIKYAETLPPQVVNKTEFDNIPKGLYSPPRTVNTAVWKINSYFKEASGGLDKDKLSQKQAKGVEALIGYINTYRFIHQINCFETENDRKLFESTFMRHTYDKPDLSQEEVDQYIMVATETVNAGKAWKRKEQLEKLQDEAYEASEDDKRLDATMKLVEAIGKAEASYNNSQKRLNDLLDSLKVKRSKRLEQKIQESASVLNLVEAWKNEESRNEIIKIVEKQRESLDNEIDRLTNMEEVKCRILGISRAEIMDS